MGLYPSNPAVVPHSRLLDLAVYAFLVPRVALILSQVTQQVLERKLAEHVAHFHLTILSHRPPFPPSRLYMPDMSTCLTFPKGLTASPCRDFLSLPPLYGHTPHVSGLSLPPAIHVCFQVTQLVLERKLAEHVERIDTDMALEFQVGGG